MAWALAVAPSACGTDPAGPVTPAGPTAPPPPPPPLPRPPPPPAPNLANRFGAKFEPPVGRVLHGIGQWEQYNLKYTALLPPGGQPASELMFFDLGDTPRPWNPAEIAQAIAKMQVQGRIPSLDISLRGLQPTPAELQKLPDPLYGIDHDVANTTKYDGRIKDLIQVLKSYKKPALLRIGGEFNGWWNGYHPYEYPKAFRKIVTMFRQAGVENVAFVWCYEPAAPDDFDAVNASGQPKWYPGADVVDWFSIDLYAKADVSGPTAAHGALTPYFALMAARPEIKWFHYVNYDWTQASYYQNQGWQNNDLSANSAVSASYLAELGKVKYLHAGEKGLLKDYGKYQ